MASVLAGQMTITGSAQQVDPTNTASACKAFTFKTPVTNTATVFIGPSTVGSTGGFALDPGDQFTYERISQNGQPEYPLKPSDFYALGTTSDQLTWLASP